MAWTDEKVEKLKVLWAEGVTAAEIAKALGDVSRNAVIGKAHRLKLPNRVAPTRGAETNPEEPCELTERSKKKQEAAKGSPETRAQDDAAAKPEDKAAATTAKSAGRARAKAETSPSAKAPEKTVRDKAAQGAADAAQAPRAEDPKRAAGRPDAETDAAVREQDAFEAALENEGEEESVNPVAALAAEAERTARKLSLLELNERTCKWPIGDPSTDDFYFCGHPCAPEKPYCAAHVQVAYQPMSSRRDRERSRARAASA